MDARIVKALRALGLSEETVDGFAELVDGVKERIRAEGLITRNRKARKANLPEKRKRQLIVKYQPKGTRSTVSYASRATASLRAIEKSQTPPVRKPARATQAETVPARRQMEPGPDAPPWQRRQFDYAQRFRRSGVAQAVARTIAKIEGLTPIR